MVFRCTFPAGFSELVAELAARDIPGCRIVEGDNSSLILESTHPLADLPYLQGSAFLAASAPAGVHEPTLDGACRHYRIRGLGSRATEDSVGIAWRRKGRPRTFALRTFKLGSPAAVEWKERAALEHRIAELTGLRPDSRRPDLDFQIHLRSDGRSYFTVPLRQGSPVPPPPQGALPPHTACLLCELSRPSRQDVFLDPFMGSGAIPLQRARMAPYSMIFAGDTDANAVETFIRRLSEPGLEKRRRTIFPKHLDATELSRFDQGFFSVIVTDPPWGEYKADGLAMGAEELRRVYAVFFREARRVTAHGGRLVLLTGRTVPLEEALADSGAEWQVEREYRVLISGKKARASVFI